MPEKTVHVSVNGGTATVTLDRPQVRNALAFEVHHRLGDEIAAIAARPEIRFIVLRGANGFFSSGGDLSDIAKGFGPDYLRDYWQRMNASIVRFRTVPQIVVAAVEGAALGAGAALALAADIVLASSDARFRWNFVKLGLLPDAGTSVTLTRCMGPARAREVLMTGRWMGAEEAHASGIVSRLAACGQMDGELGRLLAELMEAPTHTLALLKNLLEGVSATDLAAAARLEGVYQLAAAASGDYRDLVDRAAASMGRGRTVD